MFDIGWLELLVIGIVALIVVGPKDLPGMFRTVGQFVGKARAMAREFQRSMEAAADESGLKEAADSLNSIKDPLAQARHSAKDYAKNYVTQKDAKSAAASDEKVDWVAEGERLASPAAKATAKKPAAEAADPAVTKAAAKKPAAKKPAAKKPAAKKPAAKTPAAKAETKLAAKKPASKKPAAKKSAS